MSIPCRLERSLVSHDEFELVRVTHHPFIYELEPEQLQATRVRLREWRSKERTLAQQKRRELRGKAEPRGSSFPGTTERPSRRKQVFAGALKRVDRELARRRQLEARTLHVEAARRALALRRSANFVDRPDPGMTAGEGMRALPSRRRRTKVAPAMIGSISQAVKAAQARRDAVR
jgi:hypothetical protein